MRPHRFRLHRHHRRHRGIRHRRRRDDRRVRRGAPGDRRPRDAPRVAASPPGSDAEASNRGTDAVRLRPEQGEVRPAGRGAGHRRPRRDDPAPEWDGVHPDRESGGGHPADRDGDRPGPDAERSGGGRDVRPVQTSTGCYPRAAASDRDAVPAWDRVSRPADRAWRRAAAASGPSRPGPGAPAWRPPASVLPASAHPASVRPASGARPVPRTQLPACLRARPPACRTRLPATGPALRDADPDAGRRASDRGSVRPYRPSCPRPSPYRRTHADDARRGAPPSTTPISRTRPAP